ncbi:MAG: trypsin-like peptidase domain-containing protein, partial [Bacteroidota bacterium]
MRHFFLSLLILGSALQAKSQLLSDDKPVTLTKPSSAKQTADVLLPPVELARLIKEDELNDKFKDRPWRFGENVPVDLDPTNSGNWQKQGQNEIWTLDIDASQAVTLNYFFSAFNFPPSARLFIIDKTSGDYFGAITALNNSELNNLSTWPFRGSHHQLQLVVNSSEKKAVKLHLAEITHGYRQLKSGQGIGDSDPCNVNAICPVSGSWSNQRNASVMIVSGGSGYCSGTLMNNTLQDGRPYVLTAEHCGFKANWAFRFNFQSADCNSNNYTAQNQSISGAKQLAHNGASDFSLLEMNARPPASFNPYYAGWDNTDNIPSSQFAFHHPSGDLKKFSRNTDPGIKAIYLDATAGALTWKVDEWETGTTEGGSSGSALFDQNGRVIGQLDGGEASCQDLDKSDYFGRLAVSFINSNDSSRTLKYWLDPGMTGTTVLDGYNPTSAKPALDVAIARVKGVEFSHCSGTIEPEIVFTNRGTQTITSVVLKLSIDGNVLATSTWTGSLASEASASFSFPSQNLGDGAHTMVIQASSPNNSTDNVPQNNTTNFQFTTRSAGMLHTVNVTLDQYGSENSWVIRNTSGIILYTQGPFADDIGGTTISTKVCLEPGCYKFEFTDAYGDGMCCSFGNGSYQFVESRGTLLASGWNTPDGPDGIPITETTQVCIQPNSIINYGDLEFRAWPNPASDKLNLSFGNLNSATYEVFDITGKVVETGEIFGNTGSIDLREFKAG